MDASGPGMGGFWSSTTGNFLWRTKHPLTIASIILTANNKIGSIMINDLELAAIIMGVAMSEQYNKTHHMALS
jgi:hypothetical protein